jgi:hypothetical protein
MKPDFSYRIDGMFALILPESLAGEKAMGELMRMTDDTSKVFSTQLNALKSDLHRAGYTIRKRSARKTCSKADLEHLFCAISQ